MNNTVALIMAGGIGSRFWPKSRKLYPKQFLSLFGNSSMLQMTTDRLTKLVPWEKTFIVSTKNQVPFIQQQIPGIKAANIISEPYGKNTAPCIGLAAIHIQHEYPDAVMIVSPADHLILNNDVFAKVLQTGVSLVRENPLNLVTIGIEPTYAATGYGYIQKGEPIKDSSENAYIVRTFAEKPDLEIAQKFFSSNEFLWNSGIFVWHVNTILEYFHTLLPDIYDGLMQIKAALGTDEIEKITDTVYRQIHSQSIDYGILEKASRVIVLEGHFGWSDVGSWQEVYNISDKDENGNVVKGEPILKEVKNSYIEVSDRMVSIIGVEDLIVVDTADALLITKKDFSQDVKWVVEKLNKEGKKKYL